MTQQNKQNKANHQSHFNSIWLVPLIALLVAGWMLYQDWASKGPVITIISESAEGIEVGKTTIKELSVVIGKVTDVKINETFDKAILTVQMNQGTKAMLREDTQFWVVKPRVGAQGVSGLDTLLSGAYIDIAPGTKGKLTKNFTMLEQPPLSTAQDEGIRLKLFNSENSQLSVGTTVHFRGYPVGHIEKVGYDIERKALTYQIFIHAPYDALVNDAIQFWMTPGLLVKSSAKGIEVRLDSFENFVSGGISFGLPTDASPGGSVEDLSEFRLYSTKEEGEDNRYHEHFDFVVLFNESIAGLEAGAPIVFHGIQLGSVTKAPFLNASLQTMRQYAGSGSAPVPVLIRIEPQRLQGSNKKTMSTEQWQKLLTQRANKGLRAVLTSGNLLTGSKSISLELIPDSEPVKWTKINGYTVFPSAESGFANIEQKVNTILDHLVEAPINDTLNNLNLTLKEATATLSSVDELSDVITQLINQDELQTIPAELNTTLQQVSATLSSYQENGEIGGSLQQSLQSLERSLAELHPLLKELREQPNTLIFDKDAQPDIQPPAAK